MLSSASDAGSRVAIREKSVGPEGPPTRAKHRC
ncbi:DUF6053 domain-containing protein [Lysobacter enzymogenes]